MKNAMLKRPFHDDKIDKKAYDAWVSTGSLVKAWKKLMDEGVLSPDGKPYSEPGVHTAALRYMINHYEESKQMLLDTYEKYGYIVEESFIERYMIKMTVFILRKPERVKFWLVKHDLLEKHKDYIASLIAISND